MTDHEREEYVKEVIHANTVTTELSKDIFGTFRNNVGHAVA
jgi:hypothetical protein